MESQRSAPVLIYIITLSMVIIPLIALNIAIAKRKGKNPLVFGVLSIIPLFTFVITLYLASMTDYKVIQQIDILKQMVNRNRLAE